ncbi:MAG TPA: molybdopterin dinucleotide binding domain-containing protein, partial [Pyrinomonadaceae bacterium]|nr:molybdopterin dinucleotide binding domain-containing protein [Pyrinomonadaceae bacterium]
HLEAGHYFNPHAQRVIEAKADGAKLIVFDTRLSNTATHADYFVSPYPGSEPAIVLSIANYLIRHELYNVEYVRHWWNWEEFMAVEHPERETNFENFQTLLGELYAEYTFEFASQESGVDAKVIEEIARVVATAGTRFSSHNWRSASAGNSGGWQVTRTLFMLNALLGAVATEGGVFPNAWNKFVPKPIYSPPHPPRWNELTWPREYPLAMNELSFLLPHFLKEGRGRVDVYFTRVYNPVWTNPDGFSWVEVLNDESLINCYVALTPTWNETAYFADYILPMGHGSERHDVHSYETHDAQWIGFRQPVLRAARERLGAKIADTREINPGEVWEENEFWLELSWRIDPDGALGIRQYVESKERPGERLSVDEYYSYMFENSVPGLPERAARENLSAFEFMRRYGSFEVRKKVGAIYRESVPEEELEDTRTDHFGRVYTKTPKPPTLNIVPIPSPDGDAEGRRLAGVRVDGETLRGFPTPSGRLEFYSRTLADWGWPEYIIPTYIRSHIHPANLAADQTVLISTFRLPVQIHTRSANAKWLDEIAHTNPLWIHTSHAARLNVRTGDLVRVETEIGYFVVRAWVTEGIKPGIVACSHHMGRWKLKEHGQRQMMATVSLEHEGERWGLRRERGVAPYESADADTLRIWWTDVGVHQNLTFPVHPDPVSGMHCWHQAVRVTRAEATDAYGDISVDTEKSHEVYRKWLARTRGADRFSPDGTRRPYWLLRPLKPAKEVYRLPDRKELVSTE